MFGRKKGPGKSAINRTDQLQSDYTLISGSFKSHPYIHVKETFGVPAEKYVILYNVEGLQLIGKAIEAKSEHVVEILLPPGYPDSAPLCKRISPVFHPNMTAERIDIKGNWSKGTALSELVVRIGEMITFQKYVTEGAINAEACKWAERNADLLPLSKIDLRVRTPEPVSPLEEIKSDPKESGEPVSDNIFVNEIVINDPEERQAVDGLDDGRKTEGIVIENDTAALAVEPIAKAAAEPVTAVLPPSPEAQRPEKAKTPLTVTAVSPGTTTVQKLSSPPMVLFQFFYCPYCGNKNNKDANFCMTCGARLKPMKKTNYVRMLSIAAMIVIPVGILIAGITTIVTHDFFHPAKDTVTVPAGPSTQPVEETSKAPPQEPDQSIVKKAPDEAVTPTSIEEKMAKPQEAAHKNQNVFAPERLTEQQKTEKIANLLQNARLYMNIGSYDDAIKRYREVLKLSPTNFEASMGLDSAQEAKDKTPPRLPASGQSDE